MSDNNKENQNDHKEDVKIEDLQPDDRATDEVKGGQRGGATWIFSGS